MTLTGAQPGTFAVAMLIAGLGALALPGKWGVRVLLLFLFITIVRERRLFEQALSELTGISTAILETPLKL